MNAKGINVSETNIGKILGEMNPEAQRKRHNVASRWLNSKVYNAKFFGLKTYYDQNYKLGMFGVAHVCARDGFPGVKVLHKIIEIISLRYFWELQFSPSLRNVEKWSDISSKC